MGIFIKGTKVMTLTKDLIADRFREKIGCSNKEGKDLIEMILEEIKHSLEEGTDVKISGFGKWRVRQKRSRRGRNPHTGKQLEITARTVVTFHPSDKLRDAIDVPQQSVK